MTDPAPWVQRREEQAKEYGQFVANTKIYHNGSLAYLPGHPVPVSNVKKYAYDKQGLVDRVGASQASPKEGNK